MAIRSAGHLPARKTDPSLYLDSSDEMLMEMFQKGDALAFYALLERHVGMVCKIARQYFGPKAEIDDLVQDLTLTLWQNKNAWKHGSARLSSWLYKVASNKCIDMLRQKRIPTHDGIVPDNIMAHDPSAEDRVASQQQAKQMQGLLAELPVSQKLALTLYYYEEASLHQIAKRLDVSELAARSLLKRGKQNLRGLMARESVNSLLT